MLKLVCLKRAMYDLFQAVLQSNKYAFISTTISFNVTSMSEHFLAHHKSTLRRSSSNKCVKSRYSKIAQCGPCRSVPMKRDLASVMSFCIFKQLSNVAFGFPDEAMPDEMFFWRLKNLFCRPEKQI